MFHRKSEEDISPEQLSQELKECRARREVLAMSIRALAYYLKESSFDLADINSDQYKSDIDEMVTSLLSEDSPRSIEHRFEREKKHISAFMAKEKAYLDDREAEFKNVIELLRKGLADMIGENREFGNKIYEGNLRMEEVSKLDDLRRVKESLKAEIAQMRDVVREKQSRDEQRLTKLSKEVSILKTDLERVHEASITDPLTGASNRYSFDTYLHRCVERNVIAWKPFCVLMCDLDKFKEINDTHGHRMGDRVLRVFVNECKSILREEDYMARFGGDEFVIVLQGANLRNACGKAQRICHLLDSKEYLIRNQQEESVRIRFSVSIGVAEAHKRDTLETLIERADAALYQAKHQGRNRTVTEREVKSFLAKAG